jgi:hypothetical protein
MRASSWTQLPLVVPGPSGHLQWFYEVANYTQSCLARGGHTAESAALARRLDEPRFGFLSAKDRQLLRDAVSLRCDSFLTMERRLPRNAAYICRHLGIRVFTPIVYLGNDAPVGGALVLARPLWTTRL